MVEILKSYKLIRFPKGRVKSRRITDFPKQCTKQARIWLRGLLKAVKGLLSLQQESKDSDTSSSAMKYGELWLQFYDILQSFGHKTFGGSIYFMHKNNRELEF